MGRSVHTFRSKFLQEIGGSGRLPLATIFALVIIILVIIAFWRIWNLYSTIQAPSLSPTELAKVQAEEHMSALIQTQATTTAKAQQKMRTLLKTY